MRQSISTIIHSFIHTATQLNWLDDLDTHYVTNRLMSLLHLDEITDDDGSALDSLLPLMDQMVEYAIEHQIIENISYQREQLEAAIMDLITPLPSQINTRFWQLYAQNKESATDYFYQLSQTNDYIKTRNIQKNIQFTKPYKHFGELDITINLSKPEKDPKEIALAKTAKPSNYPKCVLCMENEGYLGRQNHPARQQHRLIRLTLNQKTYGMQYSPYVYYNEHSIFLSDTHTPMQINRQALDNLLAIVDILPHYFAGSNADLPIVGGSILAHDHYQGGRYEFPMAKAPNKHLLTLTQFPDLQAAIVNWPMSVIRITGKSKERVAQAGEALHHFWQNYFDEQAHIHAFTDDVPHNTVTPVARRRQQLYELDIVLRNNRTSTEHPDGIFHPHRDVQHIKKENIGLIEVMGLAILPPRLVNELALIKGYLKDEQTLDAVPNYHHTWAEYLKQTYSFTNDEQLDALLKQAIANKFGRVLEDAGVYKTDDEGQAAFLRFIDAFNQQ